MLTTQTFKSYYTPNSLESVEVFGFLRDQLSQVDFQLLVQLFGQTPDFFKISPEEVVVWKDQIVSQLPQIKARLETLAERYQRDGKLIIPRRPIVSVQFEPEFSIRYGLRRYNGNPIAVYREDPTVQGLSRSGLKRADQSLYVKLRQTGQIAEAIPEVLNPLPDSEVRRIIEAHEKYKGNASKASKKLSHEVQTVVKYWHEARLQAQGKRGPTLEGEAAIPILDAHATYNGNPSQAASHVGVSLYITKKYWRDAGLPILVKHTRSNKPKPNKAEVIMSAYDTYKGNADEAAKHLPYSPRTIARQWRDSGLEVIVNKPQPSGIAKVSELSSEEIQKVMEAHKTYGGRATRAAKEVRHNINTVLNYWRNAGLRIRGQGDSNLSDEEAKEVVAAHKTYKANAKAATRHLPYSSSTILRYWREAGLRISPRGEKNALPQNKIKKILSAYSLYGGNSLEASRQIGHSDITVRKYWRQVGLMPPVSRQSKPNA